MVKLFLKIYDFFTTRKPLFFTILALVVGILLLMLSSLKYNENIFDFLPLNPNQQKAATLYQDITSGNKVVAMFSMRGGDTTSSQMMVEAVDDFAQKISESDKAGHIKEVMTQFDFEKIANLSSYIYENLPIMLSESDYTRMDSLLSSSQFIDEQLSSDVQMILMPSSGFLTTNISYDPLSLFAPVWDRLQTRQSNIPFEIDDGYIFTSGRKYAIAMLTSSYGAVESANNTLLINYIDSISNVTMQLYPDVEIAITGSPVIAVDNSNRIKSDSRLAVIIAIVLIISLLIYSFRSTKNILLIVFSILFGWLFAMGFIAVLRNDVSLIVLGIGSIIIGIAVNYPLHFIAHIEHVGTTKEALKEMVPPLLIGNITTVGAFVSLIPLNAPALRDLGLFAAFMLVGTILFVLIFLPHLVRKRASESKHNLPFEKISSLSFGERKWVIWMILLLTVIFGYFSLRTSFDSNMHNINYMTPTQQRLMEDLHISAGVTDTSNIYLVSNGSSWEEALSRREMLKSSLDSLKNLNYLSNYSDVTNFVSSISLQQKRIELWNRFWDNHRENVISAIRQKATNHGFSDDAFENFERIVSQSYTPKDFEEFELIRSLLLSGSFSTVNGEYSVVDIVDVGDADLDSVKSTLNNLMGERGFAFDFAGMNSAIAKSLSDDFNYIGFACALIVFVFLWLSMGRLELSILAFIPMAVGWLWILGIMSLLGMKFNIVNVILATFIFGQGDDYTIFITDGLINEYAFKKKVLPSYKNSIIISALIMFIGIGSLIVAKHPALHSLAEVTIVGMLTVVLMAWIVPPIIFNMLTKKGNSTRRFPLTITLRRNAKEYYFKEKNKESKDTHYYHKYVLSQYIYKGIGFEREARKMLRRYDDFSQFIDVEVDSDKVFILNEKVGVFSSLFALVHPNVEVYSYSEDEDTVALLSACDYLPENLHINLSKGSGGNGIDNGNIAEIIGSEKNMKSKEGVESKESKESGMIIDLSLIINRDSCKSNR